MESFTERVSTWFRRRFDPEGWAEEQAALAAESMVPVNGSAPAVALAVPNGGSVIAPPNHAAAGEPNGHEPVSSPPVRAEEQ
jgi:HAE1 family hydrophobic/amphiphilic exporter-1